MEETRTLEQWLEILGNADHPDHRRAVEILTRLGPQALSALLEALASSNWVLRYRAAEVLGRMEAREAVKPLCQLLLQDPNTNVRWGAAVALGRIGDRRAALALRRAARSDWARTSWGEPVADAAAGALGQLRRGLGVPPVLPWSFLPPRAWIASALGVLLGLGLSAALIWFGWQLLMGTPPSLGLAPTPTPTAAPTPTPQPTATSTPVPSPTPTTTPTPEPVQLARVTAQAANVRSGPGTENEKVGLVVEGDLLEVLGEEEGWYRIRPHELSEDSTLEGEGWIFGELVELLPTPTPAATATP